MQYTIELKIVVDAQSGKGPLLNNIATESVKSIMEKLRTDKDNVFQLCDMQVSIRKPWKAEALELPKKVHYAPKGNVICNVPSTQRTKRTRKQQEVSCRNCKRKIEEKDFVICSVCKDTHKMAHPSYDYLVMCTHCPTPCKKCGQGPYCATTPCSCDCH